MCVFVSSCLFVLFVLFFWCLSCRLRLLCLFLFVGFVCFIALRSFVLGFGVGAGVLV